MVRKHQSKYKDQLSLMLLSIPDYIFSQEHQFHAKRKWRFDYCIDFLKIAIEYEGGTFSNGGHGRGKVYAANCEKYNQAALGGWIVLRYTCDMIQKNPGQVIDDIKQAIAMREEGLINCLL